MRCVANFEIGSEISVVSDDTILTINDPKGAFKARIKNIPRSEFTTPFLLSLHIYFEAKDLGGAEEVADELLAKCLNMLAFTTGGGFRKHRTRQIVDAETSSSSVMREILMWGEKVEYDDPQPFLRDVNVNTISRLLEHEVSPAIERALRWYRLGIDASSPDDQFTYFWFAIEIVAEFKKAAQKVNDKCPHCQSPLYCEQCDKHPLHRPYAKQAIHELMKAADQKCDEATVQLLDQTRNKLMHGKTLKEVESELPNQQDHVVDILGNILWKALVMQFPRDMFDGELVMGMPSTFIHYKINTVAHMQTVVPMDAEGHLDLKFKGITMKAEPSGPPQSALAFGVKMTKDQYDQLRDISYIKGNDQKMLERMRNFAQEHEGSIIVRVLATDMKIIKKALEEKQEGEWQVLFSEILEPLEEKGGPRRDP
jgi:hypothetical protein